MLGQKLAKKKTKKKEPKPEESKLPGQQKSQTKGVIGTSMLSRHGQKLNQTITFKEPGSSSLLQSLPIDGHHFPFAQQLVHFPRVGQLQAQQFRMPFRKLDSLVYIGIGQLIFFIWQTKSKLIT